MKSRLKPAGIAVRTRPRCAGSTAQRGRAAKLSSLSRSTGADRFGYPAPGPGVGGKGDRRVVGVERGLEQEERGDAPGDVLDLAHLVDPQRPAQDPLLTVGQPLLEHLVAPQSVVPDTG